MAKIGNDHKEFIKMDLDLGISNIELARRFGVSEGTIRYHKKKQNWVSSGYWGDSKSP